MAISRWAVAILAALALAARLPQARAGAVFEIRESTKDGVSVNDDLKFFFNQDTNFAAGKITRAAGNGAGFVFLESAVPLAIFELNVCSAVAPHVHPNSAETLFVLEGSIKVYQFRGDDDKTNVRVTSVGKYGAVYIQQGAYHMVENTAGGKTKFLQIFDHPRGGAVFAAPALAALAGSGNNALSIMKSAFNFGPAKSFPTAVAQVKADAIISFGANCNWAGK